MRVVDQGLYIDYRLNLRGIRVSQTECQLIARGNGDWESMGPKWSLPIEFPSGPETLKTASIDTVRLTAWQYDREYPGSDLRTVLAQSKCSQPLWQMKMLLERRLQVILATSETRRLPFLALI